MNFRRIIRDFFLFLLISSGIFLILEWKNITFCIANITQDIHYYRGKDDNLRKYNESVYLARSGKFQEAKSLLALTLNENVSYSEKVFELYGDIIYSMSGGAGDVLPFYKRSLELHHVMRVEQKILFLEQQQQGSRKDETATHSGILNKAGTGAMTQSSSSGSMMREQKYQEIQQLQQNRKGSVNLQIQNIYSMKGRMQEVFSVLEGAEVKKDW